MDAELTGRETLFFSGNASLLPLYAALAGEIKSRFPNAEARVQKTQISFYDRHMFACVSFARVRKKADAPRPYFILSLGLPGPLASPRAAAQTEPYPGRWTVHLPLSAPEELDGELWGWVALAHQFARNKKPRGKDAP